MLNDSVALTDPRPALQGAPAGSEIRVGQLCVDLGSYRATFRGRDLSLTTSQLEVLALLLVNRHRVCSRQELSAALGLYGNRTIDVILSVIRRQVGTSFLRNVHSMGWIVDAKELG